MTGGYGPTVPFCRDLHQRKYRAPDEDFLQFSSRLANHLKDGDDHGRAFEEVTREMEFMAGGRVQSACGSIRRVTAFNCLSGDTEVLTEHGFVRLDEAVGKSLRVLSPVTGGFERAEFKSYGTQRLWRVEISNSRLGQERAGHFEVLATKNHRWVLQDGSVVEELRPGMVLKAGDRELDEAEVHTAGFTHGLVYGDGSKQREGKFLLRLCGKKAHHVGRILTEYPEARVTWPESTHGDPLVVVEDDGIDMKVLPDEHWHSDYLGGFVQGLLAADGCLRRYEGRSDPFAVHGREATVRWVRDHLVLAGYAPCGAPHVASDEPTNYGERTEPLWVQVFRPCAEHRGFRVVSVDPTDRIEEVYCCEEPVTRQIVLRNGLRSGNCFVSGTIHDSFVHGGPPHDEECHGPESSIMGRTVQAATTMRMGGGIGYDFSTLRPRGANIEKLDSRSCGPVGFMPIYSAVALATSSTDHRRGAQMGVMRVDHPDIEEFIAAKQGTGALTGFNLSVAVTHEFMECKASGRPFALRFNGVIHRHVDPNELWDKIMRSTWAYAEPGVLFIDTINDWNNLRYCETIAATNPCVPGETPILTSSGHVQIRDRVGLETEVWTGEGWETVTPFSTGVNPLVEVRLSNGQRLRCTPYHRFLLTHGREVEARDLVAGNCIQPFDMPTVAVGEDPRGDAYSQGFYSGDGSAGCTKSWVYAPKYAVVPRLRGSVGANEHPTRHFRVWSHGPMLDKAYVPVEASSPYCLEWFAGLLDADGTVARARLPSLQVSSVDRAFLERVQLMLTRLGVLAHLGETGSGHFDNAQPAWRLCVNQTDTQHLISMGLLTSRLDLWKGLPQRDARRHVTVVEVIDLGIEEETFCYTSGSGRGTFNGVPTLQCGEQPLPPFGACLLGSYNLVKFVRQSTFGGRYFDFERLAQIAPAVVRAMDNVVDRTVYPLDRQELEARRKRRMGMGMTGLANAGEALGLPYGTPEFLEFEDRVGRIIRDESYRASIELAREKGSFPYFDAEKFGRSKFVRTLPDDIQWGIQKYGIRNSHLTSIAPTGTISLAADNVSSSIEPVFAYSFTRTEQRFGGPVEVEVEDYGVREFGVRGRRCVDIGPEEHVAVLATAQRNVDSACSKTVNCNPGMPWADFVRLYDMAYESGCKGMTTYTPNGNIGAVLVAKDEPEPGEAEGPTCEVDPATGRRSCE